MIRFSLRLAALFLLAAPLMAAAPAQEGLLGDLPWWIWLVAISFLLLILFVVIVAFDWGSASGADGPEDE